LILNGDFSRNLYGVGIKQPSGVTIFVILLPFIAKQHRILPAFSGKNQEGRRLKNNQHQE
jgi:hypothetical protein